MFHEFDARRQRADRQNREDDHQKNDQRPQNQERIGGRHHLNLLPYRVAQGPSCAAALIACGIAARKQPYSTNSTHRCNPTFESETKQSAGQ
jgi:hypothetical protein